ncbi:hypothetical protein SAMN05446037_100663 [Anaerovirgula multivorans]|uniref:Uncharacterized protein n=1 Tax=Anaerovirgula multivorans TaxID=312168 RepID=A0A239CPZ9_9FIRM|nr:hypothetical protein [Anaerovirgula multivorans]SNS21584.1 hypothetical protein SAMN05446037_100663 [Anaerovirgula multivorans]
MFRDCPNFSPVSQDYVWLAEYYKGGLAEFDFETIRENSFYDIEKEKLVRFGLVGRKKKMWFECSRGTFNILGKRVDIRYRTKDNIYELTNQNMYQRDIITYKRAYSETNVGGRKKKGKFLNGIISYSFGYKSEMVIGETTFNFKPIVTLPHGRDNEYILTVHLVSDRDLNGCLEFVNGDRVLDSFEAPLIANVGGELNWEVKI